jgi:TonB family protein
MKTGPKSLMRVTRVTRNRNEFAFMQAQPTRSAPEQESKLIDAKGNVLQIERRRNAATDADAWKKLIGEKPVEARLATLPENKIRRSAFAASSTMLIALAVGLALLPLVFPQTLSIRMIYQVTPIAAPVINVPVPTQAAANQPKPQPLIPAQPPEPVHIAKLIAPRALVAPKPKLVERKVAEAPRLDPVMSPAKFDTVMSQPERPREPVKTGVLGDGSAAQPTLSAAVEKVQTGGFGDPHGFAGGVTEPKLGNVSRVGSFDLPSGSGIGNGTGGANGARGIVASSGFGNGVAASGPGAKSRGTVESSGFGTVTVAPEPRTAAKQTGESSAVQPVVILAKPSPVYTDEARRLRIEGEVLVEVIFRASGQVQTVRVVKGLGHGLDEAALRAAEQIRFKPAIQDGQAVDFPAVAHIVFQLAF